MSVHDHHDQSHTTPRRCRRDFLKRSAAAAAVATVGSLAIERSAHAAGDETLRVGLVGCGGRGSGAARDALAADKNAKLVALADAFPDRLEASLKGVRAAVPAQVDVTPERCFVGLDAYEKLIQCGVDVVLLCEPPGFRPRHLKAAIDAGKHVFCEKPVAVDGPGIRSVLASAEAAAKKNLNLVSGLCWRYHTAVRETIERVHDGAIGEIRAMQAVYNAGPLWVRQRDPKWTEMEFQMRDWYYFAWLSGDFNVEQHVHSLDKTAWAMRDEPPVRAWGLGGRQVRTEQPSYGHIYDHHAVVYEHANGVPVHSYCRQMGNCFSDVSDKIIGTKGTAFFQSDKCRIEGETKWQYEGPGCNMYRAEHEALFAAIRSGKTINNGVYMARSTMLGILGRMVTYTGAAITWEQAMNSQEDLSPKGYTWDAAPSILPDDKGRYPVATPGLTKFV
jgi:predicted dehydrogenase